jgi:glutamate/tyrosine decarboxylase-like PLP-dependent enzyme
MSFKTHGVNAIARVIEQNVEQARYCARLIEAHPNLELVAPVPLNIVCFRFAPADAPREMLNQLNEEILVRVQESGLAVPSGTTIGGVFALRVAITNHRSKSDDFDLLIRAVSEIGEAVFYERES